jgi:hypothetical protein
MAHPDDEQEAERLERRLQRWASELPDDQRQKCDNHWALTKEQWDALAAVERRRGPRPKPQETP